MLVWSLLRWFWEIMRHDFDDTQRAQFLTFVWGRSRLPVKAEDFDSKFTIQVLPHTHTHIRMLV